MGVPGLKRGTMVTQNMPEATLPHNREAEESLLGSLLYGGNVSRMAIEQLKPDDFYLGRHQVIFRHVIQLFADEGVIETVLLIDLLEKEEQLESAEFVAKENLRRAEEYLEYSKKLAAKGYVSEAQLEADQFAVEKAGKELDLAQTKLDVLRTHARAAKVNDLNASILTAEARLESAKNSNDLELAQEREIVEQIEKCTILSPADGEVTYANNKNKGVVIAEGEQVRENQTIIRLPDTSRLLVQAKINESRVEQVKAGMKCRITIDAIRDVELEGSVQSVSDYPWPAWDRYRAHIKEYGTKIIIINAPKGLRTGMTAKVTILSELIENALQIPLPAVFRKKGQAYCLVAGEEQELELREIELGPNNMSHAVVRSGLEEGESVVINPDPFRENFEPSEDQDLALN